MEQKQIYFEDQYLKEFKTSILKVDGLKVWLKDNLFFPKTKSEPEDLGEVSDIKIRDVEKNEEGIAVILDQEPNFKKGQEVIEKIDWDRRYNSMRLHSALHFLAGVTEKEYSVRAVAGNVYPDKAVLTFKTAPELDVVALNNKANELINQGLEVETYWDEKREGFRWCKVGDLEPIPCGGLHIKNIKEIGKISLADKGSSIEIRLSDN